jgi:hypothetical protein
MSTRVNKKQTLTNEQRLAKNREYTRKWRANKKAAEKAEAPKKTKVKAKATPQKKEQDDENSAWLKKKSVLRLHTLGAETMELNKQGERLRKLALKGERVNITDEMKNAMSIVRKFNRSQDKYRPAKKTKAITVAAPAVISMRTALDELSQQYASDDEHEDEREHEDDIDEVYRSKWSPFMNLTI